METELTLDQISNDYGPINSSKTPSSPATQQMTTEDSDEGEIIDDSDEESAPKLALKEPSQLERRVSALEKLKSLKFAGSGQNPFSMSLEASRRHSPPIGDGRKTRDWEAAIGCALNQEMGGQQRRSPSPNNVSNSRKRHHHHRYRAKDRRRSSLTPPPPLLDLEQRITKLMNSSADGNDKSHSESVLDISDAEVVRSSPAEMKRFFLMLQTIMKDHTRLLSENAIRLNELRDTFTKEREDLSKMKNAEEQEKRYKNGGSGIPSLMGISVTQPPLPVSSFTASSSFSPFNNTVALQSLTRPPSLPVTTFASSLQSTRLLPSNGMSFPRASSMLAPTNLLSQPRFDRSKQQRPSATTNFNSSFALTATTSLLLPQQQNRCPVWSNRGTNGPHFGNNNAKRPRFTCSRQRTGPEILANRSGNFSNRFRTDPAQREISEIVAIIPDEQDEEGQEDRISSDIVVVIPDDGLANLEAESRKNTT